MICLQFLKLVFHNVFDRSSTIYLYLMKTIYGTKQCPESFVELGANLFWCWLYFAILTNNLYWYFDVSILQLKNFVLRRILFLWTVTTTRFWSKLQASPQFPPFFGHNSGYCTTPPCGNWRKCCCNSITDRKTFTRTSEIGFVPPN